MIPVNHDQGPVPFTNRFIRPGHRRVHGIVGTADLPVFKFIRPVVLVDHLNMGPRYVPVVSFIITFIVVVFLVYAVGKLLEKLINLVALGFLNKIAGAVFGLLKGAVLISVVLMIINHFNEDLISEEKRSGSMLYEPIEGIAPMLWDSFRDWDLDDEKIRDLQEEMAPYSV